MKHILLFTILGTLQAERVVLNDGSVRVGNLTSVDPQFLTVVVDGRPERISKSDISLVIFDGTQPVSTRRSLVPSPAGGGTTTGLDPVAPVVSQFVVTTQGFRFELLKCTKEAQTAVVCDLRIINKTQDRDLTLYGDGQSLYGVSIGTEAVYVDGAGMQRRAFTAKIGSQSHKSVATTATIQDVPVSASVTFPPTDAGVTFLAKVSYIFHVDGKNFRVEFRRVPLQAN